MPEPISYAPIGVVRSPYTTLAGMPLQTVAAAEVDATVERGTLATRSPRRPNPIGLSLVELVRVEPTSLQVRGVDLLDGTPVLDVKPYVPLFHTRAGARAGWFEAAGERVHEVRSDARYTPPGQ